MLAILISHSSTNMLTLRKWKPVHFWKAPSYPTLQQIQISSGSWAMIQVFKWNLLSKSGTYIKHFSSAYRLCPTQPAISKNKMQEKKKRLPSDKQFLRERHSTKIFILTHLTRF